MIGPGCEGCRNYVPKPAPKPQPPYEEVLAAYMERQKPRIYTIVTPEPMTNRVSQAAKKDDVKPEHDFPDLSIGARKILFKNGPQPPSAEPPTLPDGRLNPNAEEWKYPETGLLQIDGLALGGLPGKLTVDGNERRLQWDIDPKDKEKMAGLQILLLPFEHIRATYSEMLTTEMGIRQLIEKGNEVFEKLRKEDRGGNELLTGQPLPFGAMDCLVVKEVNRSGRLGADRIRLNLGQKSVENVVTERVVKVGSSPHLKNGIPLSPLLRRGLRRLYIIPGDQNGTVVPWANTIQAKGFMEHYEESISGVTVMKSEAYEGIDTEVCISADKRELEFRVNAAKKQWDQASKTRRWFPVSYLGMRQGGQRVEVEATSSIPAISGTADLWTDLPTEAKNCGMIVIQKYTSQPAQDLGTFMIAQIDGPTLMYLAPTNHGQLNNGQRVYQTS